MVENYSILYHSFLPRNYILSLDSHHGFIQGNFVLFWLMSGKIRIEVQQGVGTGRLAEHFTVEKGSWGVHVARVTGGSSRIALTLCLNYLEHGRMF